MVIKPSSRVDRLSCGAFGVAVASASAVGKDANTKGKSKMKLRRRG